MIGVVAGHMSVVPVDRTALGPAGRMAAVVEAEGAV